METTTGKEYVSETVISSASASQVQEIRDDGTLATPQIIYPTGIRLFLIITALCLAVFLASLDMVYSTFLEIIHTQTYVLSVR